MNLSKNTFLYAYALYLIICLFLIVQNESSNNIDVLISAVTIASTLISFAELFHTKSSIDKKERLQLQHLHRYCKNKCNQIMNEIYIKYEDDASRILEENLIFDNEVEDLMLDEKTEDVDIIDKGIKKAEKKEKFNFAIANIITVIAFTSLLVVLTVDNIFGEYKSTINDFLTVFAFLSLILNIIMKDNYRAKSLKELNQIFKYLQSI